MPSAGKLRENLTKIETLAADAGMREVWRFGEMSPREIELEMRAHTARMQREVEQLDLAAWLIGSYVLSAAHAPARYPRRPRLMKRANMSDEQMRSVFCALATKDGR